MAVLIPRATVSTQVNALPSAQNTARLDTSHLQRGAQQLGDMANRYFEQQMQLADDAAIMEARNALSQWEGSINDPANPQGRFAYQGKNALQAGDALLPKADAEISRLRQSLTPRQQAKFDALAGNFRAQFQEGINRWSTQQFQGYEDATYKATVENLTNDAVASGLQGDFTRQANVANELLMINRSHLQTRGMSEELIKASERGLISGIHANTVSGMLTGAPESAMAYYDRWADQMQPEDRAKVERALYPFVEDLAADSYVDAIEAGVPVQADAPESIDAAIVQLESGGVDTARADTSRATGAGQFIDSTWLSVIKRHRPDIAQGKSDDELLALRTDGELSREMVAAYRKDNTAHLQANGIQTTATNVYAAHHFGPGGGVKFGRASMNTPMSEILTPGQLRANAYLQGKTKGEVIANWQSRGLPGGEAAAVTAGLPASEADALARAREIRDPRLRSTVQRRLQERYRLRDIREREGDRQLSEYVYMAVENADPNSGLTLRQLLPPSVYQQAAAKGMIPALEARWTGRRTGQDQVSSPDTVMALEETIYRASIGREISRVALANFNPYDHTLRLSANDRKRFAAAQVSLLSGDQKQVIEVASEAEVNSIIKNYTISTLGIPEGQIGKDTDLGRRAWDFNVEMRTWAEQFTQDNKRKPKFSEVQEHADLLTLQGTIKRPGRVWGTNRTEFRVADLNIPPAQLSQIEEALRIEGKELSAENIADKWRRFGGAQ